MQKSDIVWACAWVEEVFCEKYKMNKPVHKRAQQIESRPVASSNLQAKEFTQLFSHILVLSFIENTMLAMFCPLIAHIAHQDRHTPPLQQPCSNLTSSIQKTTIMSSLSST
jgi:hypothetical protein